MSESRRACGDARAVAVWGPSSETSARAARWKDAWAKISPWPTRSGIDWKKWLQLLSEPFRASEIVGWFRRHHPEVKEQSLRAHIQGATSNASAESRGVFRNRQPLVTRIEHGLYRRFDGRSCAVPWQSDSHHERLTQRLHEVDIEVAVGRYLRDRDPNARYASFDYCFNHFQQHRTTSHLGEPTGMEASCLQLGFYLASWGMLRGSSDLLRRSARQLVPLVETIAEVPPEVWDLDSTATTPRALIWSIELRSIFVVRSGRSKHPTFWSPR